MATVTIVGAGLMGTATAWPLRDNGHTVRLVGTHLDGEIIKKLQRTGFPSPPKTAAPRRRPAFLLRRNCPGAGGDGDHSERRQFVWRALGGENPRALRPPGAPDIAITKGLEATAEGDPMILPDVLASELPASLRGRVAIAAVGGPCIAGELAGRRQSGVVFGCRDREAVEHLAAAFRTSYYHVWTTTDLVGLEICAAMKNAYTVG